MTGKTTPFALALALLVPVEWGVAHAQGTEASGQLEAAATTSPKEKMDFAASALAEMASGEKTVRKLLEQAQKEGQTSASKVQCLNNKLASIRSLQEVSAGANTAMQESLAANQNEM